MIPDVLHMRRVPDVLHMPYALCLRAWLRLASRGGPGGLEGCGSATPGKL